MGNMRCLSQTELHSILNENCTRKFGMEYNGFLSNHTSHATVALYHLGADSNRIMRFLQWYQQRLEGPGHSAHEIEPLTTPVTEVLGCRRGFYPLVDHYQSLLDTAYQQNLDIFIASEFPKLYRGVAGSALHGLIQLGYGYNVQHPRSVVEGLAYLHHSYLPLLTSITPSNPAVNEGKFNWNSLCL